MKQPNDKQTKDIEIMDEAKRLEIIQNAITLYEAQMKRRINTEKNESIKALLKAELADIQKVTIK